jgi:hypothetical protein
MTQMPLRADPTACPADTSDIRNGNVPAGLFAYFEIVKDEKGSGLLAKPGEAE